MSKYYQPCRIRPDQNINEGQTESERTMGIFNNLMQKAGIREEAGVDLRQLGYPHGAGAPDSIVALKKQLQDAKAKLGAIEKAQAVAEFNVDGTLAAANQNFLAIVGYSLGELQGQHHDLLVSPYNKTADFWSRLTRGQHESGEYKRIGRGGREIWLQCSYSPVVDE